MIDVNLALPYFGLIFIGFACGKLKLIPNTALAWMNFFIVYVALPALFYRILAQTPLEQLARVEFIFATTLATFWAFTFRWQPLVRKQRAGCSDFLLRHTALVFVGPTVDGDRRPSTKNDGKGRCGGCQAHCYASSGDRHCGCVASAAIHFQPPTALERLLQFLQNAAAPCAQFTLGVTVALRPTKKMPWQMPPIVAVKPFLPFEQNWINTAILIVALPPALNVFVFAK